MKGAIDGWLSTFKLNYNELFADGIDEVCDAPGAHGESLVVCAGCREEEVWPKAAAMQHGEGSGSIQAQACCGST